MPVLKQESGMPESDLSVRGLILGHLGPMRTLLKGVGELFDHGRAGLSDRASGDTVRSSRRHADIHRSPVRTREDRWMDWKRPVSSSKVYIQVVCRANAEQMTSHHEGDQIETAKPCPAYFNDVLWWVEAR